MNCIEIGVMPEDYTPTENKICVKSLGFHFANGKVHDTSGDKSKQSTKWREVCAPAMKGVVGTVELEVDWEADMLFWKFEGKRFGQSVLTDYLKGKEIVAYVSLVHVNDVIQINTPSIENLAKIQNSLQNLKKQQLPTNVPQGTISQKVQQGGPNAISKTVPSETKPVIV